MVDLSDFNERKRLRDEALNVANGVVILALLDALEAEESKIAYASSVLGATKEAAVDQAAHALRERQKRIELEGALAVVRGDLQRAEEGWKKAANQNAPIIEELRRQVSELKAALAFAWQRHECTTWSWHNGAFQCVKCGKPPPSPPAVKMQCVGCAGWFTDDERPMYRISTRIADGDELRSEYVCSKCMPDEWSKFKRAEKR